MRYVPHTGRAHKSRSAPPFARRSGASIRLHTAGWREEINVAPATASRERRAHGEAVEVGEGGAPLLRDLQRRNID